MKKVSLLFLFCIVNFCVYGQKTYAKGYLIKNNGDTINCYVKPIDYSQKRKGAVRYYIHSADDKTSIKSNKIKSVFYGYMLFDNVRILTEEYNFDEATGDYSSEEVEITTFMLSKLKGKINLYSRIIKETEISYGHVVTPNGMKYSPGIGTIEKTALYIGTSEDIYQKVPEKGFAEFIEEYIVDCDDLIQEIQDKEYTYWNIRLILRKYNENCADRN